jgi:Protein of unknown function (DUF1365)
MEPALHFGSLRHRRFRPVAHEFTYGLFMALLDIDRIPELMSRSRFRATTASNVRPTSNGTTSETQTAIRMWDYYLPHCEGGFWERYIGDAQLLLTEMRAPAGAWGDPLSAAPRLNVPCQS